MFLPGTDPHILRVPKEEPRFLNIFCIFWALSQQCKDDIDLTRECGATVVLIVRVIRERGNVIGYAFATVVHRNA